MDLFWDVYFDVMVRFVRICTLVSESHIRHRVSVDRGTRSVDVALRECAAIHTRVFGGSATENGRFAYS